MDRVKVALPENFEFSTFIRVRITDLNYGGHVGNDSFLSLVHEARQQFLYYHNYTELNMAGASLIMADVAIEYKQELNYGDEIKISVAATSFDKIGFDIYYLLEIKKETGLIVAGKVKTGMVCYDYNAKRKIPVPEEAIKKLDHH